MDRATYEEGLRVQESVLGTATVEAFTARLDNFDRPFMDLVTEFCWGRIWAREGLDRKTRSLLTISILTALNRPNQIKLHVRGAIQNGASEEEIRETLLHAAVYCGIPAAVDAFRVTKETLAEIKHQD